MPPKNKQKSSDQCHRITRHRHLPPLNRQIRYRLLLSKRRVWGCNTKLLAKRLGEAAVSVELEGL